MDGMLIRDERLLVSYFVRINNIPYSERKVIFMTSMETINSAYVDIDDLGEFIRAFNNYIKTFGNLKVATLTQYLIGYWDGPCYADFAYGWTEEINAKDHFEIIYPKYGNRLPYFKLNLPNYKCLLEEQV